MKVFIYTVGIYTIFTLYQLGTVESAAIICDVPSVTESLNLEENSFNKTGKQNPSYAQENDINKFLHKIQCSLEKAKPWVNELQQEAKRLEEAAKRLGIGILNSFGEFINKLAEEDTENPIIISSEQSPTNGKINGSIVVSSTTETVTTEMISEFLCPEGFIADHNGICEPVDADD